MHHAKLSLNHVAFTVEPYPVQVVMGVTPEEDCALQELEATLLGNALDLRKTSDSIILAKTLRSLLHLYQPFSQHAQEQSNTAACRAAV